MPLSRIFYIVCNECLLRSLGVFRYCVLDILVFLECSCKTRMKVSNKNTREKKLDLDLLWFTSMCICECVLIKVRCSLSRILQFVVLKVISFIMHWYSIVLSLMLLHAFSIFFIYVISSVTKHLMMREVKRISANDEVIKKIRKSRERKLL